MRKELGDTIRDIYQTSNQVEALDKSKKVCDREFKRLSINDFILSEGYFAIFRRKIIRIEPTN